MKKKTLLLSILSIIMCLSLTVGGTFALFTSKSEVNVAVTSGTVEISASIDQNSVETKKLYDDAYTTGANNMFGGVATFTDNSLELVTFVPGDGIKFNIIVKNTSNVTVKYRTVISCSEDNGLFDGLDVSIAGIENYNGKKYVTNWASLDAGSADMIIPVEIELPELAGDEYQTKTCKINYFVEAVQGNAPVANVNAEGETTTDTNLTDNKGNSAVAPAGVDMKDGETTLTLKVEEAQSANTGNFSFGTDSKAYAYEVKVPEVAEDNDEEIIVTMAVPAGLQNVLMFHKGIAMNPVANADAVVNHNEFFYDVAGFITFATKNFSNFTIVDKVNFENLVFVGSAEELKTALSTNDGKEIIFKNDISVVASKGGYNMAGIVVDGDIVNGNGYTLTASNAWTTWDCAIAMTAGTVKNLTVSSAMRGIFMPGAKSDVVIDNVTFSNVIYTFNSDAGDKNYSVTVKNSALNGWTSFSNVHKEVLFENCTFAKGNGYAFCRPYNEANFVGCEFEAGFEMEPLAAVSFENCTINGEAITEENLATLVVSNAQNVTFVKYIATAQELASALTDGGKYALSNDIVLDAPISIADGVKTTLNMKGFAISYESSVTGKNTYAIDVHGNLTVSNGSLTFKHVGDDMSWNNCTAIFHLDFNGKLTLNNVNVENLGGTSMAYGVDITNVYAKNNSKLTIYNSNLKSTYIAVRVFNNGDGVHNVQINDSKLEGKYAFWVQYYIGDFKDEATTELKVANLNIDIYNDDNIFVGAENVVSAILYGFNEATYFNANGEVIA